MPEGVLDKLAIRPGRPARYRWQTVRPESGAAPAPAEVDLDGQLGRGLSIEFLGEIVCSHCARATPKSYGGGYCYDCFRGLARCDLCVVSPERCHYHLGTCREPAWGEAFCMQPHVVYLANSSGPKVGVTTAGGELTRWLDQGATQGLLIAAAPTRHLAGVLEARLATLISDRTDWRALVQGDAPAVDLAALAGQLRERVESLPEGVRWVDGGPSTSLSYPVLRYPRHCERLRLDRHRVVSGRLLGMKGQFLLFDHGVFDVRWHRAFRVRLELFTEADDVAVAPLLERPADSQMELFS